MLKAGRDPEQLAKDLGGSHQSLAAWRNQADLDAGARDAGLTTEEREELRRLRRRVSVLEEEKESQKKPPAASSPCPPVPRPPQRLRWGN